MIIVKVSIVCLTCCRLPPPSAPGSDESSCQPIRGQYSGHVTNCDQSEASIVIVSQSEASVT